MPEVDDDQLAALRRLRAAFGPIEVIEVVGRDPDEDPAALAGRADEAGSDGGEPSAGGV